ncbi:hypothetical protein ACP70R_038648 [Stipagrostis hirtigluma subsp. patula]
MRARMEAGAERHEASSRVFPRVPVSPPPSATASRALILRRSPFRPQMEPKRSSAQPQYHSTEPKKPSPRAAGTAAAPATTTDADSSLSSLFCPPAQRANGKDQDLYRILYKGGGSAQAGMTVMVNPSGLLPEVVPHTPRIINIRSNMIRLIHLVLGHPCTMVVEIIFMAALQPNKPQIPRMITRWIRRTQPLILMATGGKVHITTNEVNVASSPRVDKMN